MIVIIYLLTVDLLIAVEKKSIPVFFSSLYYLVIVGLLVIEDILPLADKFTITKVDCAQIHNLEFLIWKLKKDYE